MSSECSYCTFCHNNEFLRLYTLSNTYAGCTSIRYFCPLLPAFATTFDSAYHKLNYMFFVRLTRALTLSISSVSATNTEREKMAIVWFSFELWVIRQDLCRFARPKWKPISFRLRDQTIITPFSQLFFHFTLALTSQARAHELFCHYTFAIFSRKLYRFCTCIRTNFERSTYFYVRAKHQVKHCHWRTAMELDRERESERTKTK